MVPKIILIVSMLFTIAFFSDAATINQRQTGDLNVHVNVKDFKIIALMKNSKEEYMDYDYAYDYSEMTIKPQTGSSLKPLNQTTTDFSADNSTETTTQSIVEITLAPVRNVSVSEPLVQNNTAIPLTELPIYNTTPTALDPSSSASPNVEEQTSVQPAQNGTECRKGFSVNKKGECELKLQTSSTNALLNLVKLSQKLKLRREN